MRKWLIIIALGMSFACGDDNDQDSQPTITPASQVRVFTQSSALNPSLLEGRTRSSHQVTEQDWIFDEIMRIAVVGVRCKIDGINLVGDPGLPTEQLNTGITDKGLWQLFSGTNITFDLADLEEILTTRGSVVVQEGELNVVLLKMLYLELDILFKESEHTIRIYWRYDNASGARVLDILIEENGVFKWINPDDKSLIEVRPSGMDDVVRIFVHPSGRDNSGGFGPDFILDHFDNLAFINDPHPWSETDQGDPERLKVFYEIDDDTSAEDLDITLDLSFKNAAAFTDIRGKFSVQGIDTSADRFVFNVDPDTNELYDLDGNSIDSPEFDIYDLLPGMQYPDVMVHVTVQMAE